jgi:SAM-dependent methyltransferase
MGCQVELITLRRDKLTLTIEELKGIADSVGDRRGWDFSRVKSETDPVPWNYPDVVRKYVSADHEVLDVGTGGGEQFSKLASSFRQGIGIDPDLSMIDAANKNLSSAPSRNLRFQQGSAEKVPFEDESFDIVLNRHAPVMPQEVLRVLRPNGHFATQQVGGNNTQNIFDAFGWESNAVQTKRASIDSSLIAQDAGTLAKRSKSRVLVSRRKASTTSLTFLKTSSPSSSS